MRLIGFSTGAIALGEFRRGLEILIDQPVNCVELSALRLHEVAPLLQALPDLILNRFEYVSFHAPSSFSSEKEQELAESLYEKVPREWPIILHPDTISDFQLWRRFGSRLVIENMDRRKPIGRNVTELERIFARLPEAHFCFDIGHARQCDTSMTEAYLILQKFGSRLRQVHMSEVNSASQHDAISYTARLAFKQIAWMIPLNVPVILESRVRSEDIASEISMAIDCLSPSRPMALA
jgi:hypothetical protein